jgi:hypothetical protein
MVSEPLGRTAPLLSDIDGGLREPFAIRAPGDEDDAAVARSPAIARVQLIGTHLRAEGSVDLGHFVRLSDYVNVLDGFFTVHDVVLLSRLGGQTRITFPDFRVRLDEIAIVGQAVDDAVHDEERVIPKQRRRLVVTTGAHIIYGYAFMHEQAALTAFVDSTDPAFMPMTNVRVRWLADRRLAGRFAFALVHRRQIIGVATEVGTGLTLLTGRGAGSSLDEPAAASAWSAFGADASSR